jgi:hypothetical protein
MHAQILGISLHIMDQSCFSANHLVAELRNVLFSYTSLKTLQILESSNSEYNRPAFDGTNISLCTADFCKLLSMIVGFLDR